MRRKTATPLDLGTAPATRYDVDAAELLELGRGREPEGALPDPIDRLRGHALTRAMHPAVIWRGEVISYAKLARRVGQLAQRLRQLGVEPESRVGICTSRGPDELVSMLATWAAGGAYVPLDFSHPAERIRMILEDARPEVLITQRAIAEALDIPSGVHVLALDEEEEALARLPELPLVGAARPTQLAYVLFTSGSTGRPKGVAIERLAIHSFLRSMAHTPGLGPSDRLLAVTTTTFDIAGLELLLPVCVGATVEIADRETVLDAHKLRAVLEGHGITVMQATPTAWRLLLEAGWGASGTTLRMLCGGEAMSPELAERLTATGGELWNMYGPTETTVWSTLARIERGAKVISIGRPIDATQIYIVGDDRELVPRGEVGELCIGGVGLARGYLDRDALTREKFIPHPWGAPGERIYRTGDLARWLPSGDVECLGRIDHQVKIRGFRIELGEIESCLRSVEHVREAVVVARPASDGEPMLVAYWVGPDAPREELERRVRAKLPSYMHPSAYVRVDEMPLNTNGKIDRKALPAPEDAAVPTRGLAPRTDSETRMAALFTAVLGVDHVPVDRDFFLLGGSSVRATELRRRILDEFGVELPLAAMFESPTVESLVQKLGDAGEPNAPLVVPLRRGRADAPPLLCLLGITLYRELAQALDTDRAVYGLHIPYSIPRGQPHPTVSEVARRYVELILERFPEGPYHVAGLCFGGFVAAEVARELCARGHEVQTVALFDAPLPRAIRYRIRARLRVLEQRFRVAPSAALAEVRQNVKRKLGSWAAQLAPSLLERNVPHKVLADLDVVGAVGAAVIRAYDAQLQPLPVPLLVFRADERDEGPWYEVGADLGWSKLTRRLVLAAVSGGHLDIMRAPHVTAMAKVLSHALREHDAQIAG